MRLLDAMLLSPACVIDMIIAKAKTKINELYHSINNQKSKYLQFAKGRKLHQCQNCNCFEARVWTPRKWNVCDLCIIVYALYFFSKEQSSINCWALGEENDAGMAQLRASTNYSDHRQRSSQRPQQNRTPLGNLPGNAANFRTSVVEDPIIEDKPFSAPRQTGSLLARKRTSNQPSVEFQPRISSLTTPARFTNGMVR